MPPRILIAEDNDQVAAVIERLLTSQGMTVERASDGVEALGRIAKDLPSLLLLDLRLPRLHGIDLLKKLRQSPRTARLPVIIITGAYRGEPYARAARALGVAAYLEKPFKAGELLAALSAALPAGSGEETIDIHLQRALASRFSGRFKLKAQGVERELFFIGGAPVFLRPGFAHRDFGDFLQRRGLISEEEYAYYAGAGGHRHEVLVQMGCLEYPQLLQEKLAYLNAELVEAFALPPMAVEETPFTLPGGLQLLTVNIPQIFYQGFHRHHSPAVRERLLARDDGRYAAVSPEYFRYINLLSLTAEEKQLLPRLDGTRRLGECLAGEVDLIPLGLTLRTLEMLRLADAPLAAARPEGFPLRTLYNDVEKEEFEVEVPLERFVDLVEQAGPVAELPAAEASAPAPSSEDGDGLLEKVRRTRADLQGKNFYEIFGMTQAKFSFDRLKERYFTMTREFGPDLLMRLPGAEATLVEEILASVADAYNTLSDVVRKENYDQLLGSDRVGLGQKGDDRFQAQVQAQSGKVFIEMEEWDNAEKALQDACNFDPNNGDYLAHLAWAIYRNPRNTASHAMQEKARRLLNRALTLERTAVGFTFKGWTLLESGQDALAEGEFNKGLKLDARLPLARKGLRTLQEKREQERRGLFRKIFS